MSRITDKNSLPTQWIAVNSPKEAKHKVVQLCPYQRIGYVKTDQSCWRIISASRWLLAKLGDAFCITKHEAGYFTKRCLEVKNAKKFESLYVPVEMEITISVERKTQRQEEETPIIQTPLSENVVNPVLQELFEDTQTTTSVNLGLQGSTNNTQNSQMQLALREQQPKKELSHEKMPTVEFVCSKETLLRFLKDEASKREVVLACIKEDKTLFRELNDKWLDDPEMALTAILTEDNDALVLMALAIINPVASLTVLTMKAIGNTITDYSNSYQFAFVSDRLKSDPTFMKVAVHLNPLVYYYAIGEAYEDREVALEVLCHPSKSGYEYLPPKFRLDADLLLTAISIQEKALEAADDTLLDDSEFIEKALKCNPNVKDILEKLTKYRSSSSEKKNAKIAQNRNQLLKEVSQGVYNKEVLIDILKRNPDDGEITYAIVSYDKTLFKHVSMRYKANAKIALVAITATGWFETNSSASEQWAFISPTLRNDPEFVLWAVKKNPFVLYFACEALTENEEIAIAVLCHTDLLSGSAYKYVSPKLLGNVSFMLLKVIKHNARAISAVSKQIKTQNFIKEAISLNPEVKKYLNKNELSLCGYDED